MSAEKRAELVLDPWFDKERDERCSPCKPGHVQTLSLASELRRRIVTQIRQAESAALAASSERERALEARLAEVRSQQDALRKELAARPTQGAYNHVCEALHTLAVAESEALSQLAASRAKVADCGPSWATYDKMREKLRGQLTAKDAEIAGLRKKVEWVKRDPSQWVITPGCIIPMPAWEEMKRTPPSSPLAPERSPEWIAAAEACMTYARRAWTDEIGSEVNIDVLSTLWPESKRAITALRALDAQTARPAREEEAVVHSLKVWPEFFDDLESGRKPFEARKDDRSPAFEPGHELNLREWSERTGYTGRSVRRVVTYALRGGAFGIESGHVVLGIGLLREGAGA